jgi:hypothetical protein
MHRHHGFPFQRPLHRNRVLEDVAAGLVEDVEASRPARNWGWRLWGRRQWFLDFSIVTYFLRLPHYFLSLSASRLASLSTGLE